MTIVQLGIFLTFHMRKLFIISFWIHAEIQFYEALNHFDGEEEEEEVQNGCQDTSCNHDHHETKKCEQNDDKCETHKKCEDPKCEETSSNFFISAKKQKNSIKSFLVHEKIYS